MATTPDTPYEQQRAERAALPLHSTMMPLPLRVTDAMRRAEQLFPEQGIVSRLAPGVMERRSYADIGREARELAGALRELGIGPGQRVATLMWNHGRHLAAYYAVPAIQAVLHPLNPRLSADDLAWIIADAGDSALLIDADLLPLLEQIEQQVRIPHVIVNPLPQQASPGHTGAGRHDWSQLLREAEPLAQWPHGPLDENDPVSVCYTSGTTGRPKGVVYSHRSILLHGLGTALPDAFGLSGRDTLLTLTPMYHVNGWSVPYTAVMLGARQVFAGAHVRPAEVLDLILQEGVTAAFGIPTFWTEVLRALEAEPQRWELPRSLRIYAGGSPPPAEMFRRFDQLGVSLQTGWGMTETSPIAHQTWLRPHTDTLSETERLELRTSNGLPLPFVEQRHVNDEGQPLPWDGSSRGELQVRGPWITAQYLSLPQARSATSHDGWLHTGDIVTIRPDGYMRLVDRQKDLVKSGGEWISSVELENALCDHPAVREAAVIGIPHPTWVERPLALVVLRDGHSTTAADLQEHLGARMPRWMLPDRIEFEAELPRTPVGKLDKKALRTLWGASNGAAT